MLKGNARSLKLIRRLSAGRGSPSRTLCLSDVPLLKVEHRDINDRKKWRAIRWRKSKGKLSSVGNTRFTSEKKSLHAVIIWISSLHYVKPNCATKCEGVHTQKLEPYGYNAPGHANIDISHQTVSCTYTRINQVYAMPLPQAA